MDEIITLTTDRLIVRDLNYEDLDFIHVIHSNPEVQKYATLDIPESINESEDYLRKYIEQQNCNPRKEYGFCVSLVNKEPIGLIGLSNGLDKFKSAEMWFKMHPKYWGRGYITEAALVVLKFGFERLHLHRIEAGVATENIASIKVLEKIGMQKEGIRRKILPIGGEWKDNFHYAVLEDDQIKLLA
ncbi:Protein N-acetyltransferase, RimJ/RimL family [Pedobacter sp. ok626]|uniref:GNAT family N-acetyltransferase n=1 Tax=Pedobacter sp. ok626 TaxID=1761882 RepID=UPI00088FBF2B|nr:GNAT family N-acetyltransferase [Pedobacter sp. ok626]SDL79149.1 Protein N-acetyltransferase, RimJ/RimL family [Pedobacter sp. ok626]